MSNASLYRIAMRLEHIASAMRARSGRYISTANFREWVEAIEQIAEEIDPYTPTKGERAVSASFGDGGTLENNG